MNNNNPICILPNLQTVIELNANFVGHLQQAFTVSERQISEMPKKDTNMLAVKGVRSMFGLDKTVENFEVDRTEQTELEMQDTIDLIGVLNNA